MKNSMIIKPWKLLASLLVAAACVAVLPGYAPAADDGGGSGGGGSGGGGSGGGGSGGGHDSGGGGGSGGGHDSGGGGGSGGGGSGGSGGGHDSGAGGKGGEEGGGHGSGGLKLRHGLSADHQGHASGVHGNSKESSQLNNPGPSRRFGGGSGIAGADQILEGPGENAPGGNGELSTHRSQFRNQFRYWGGWTLPGEGDSGGTEGTDGITDPGFNTGGGGGAGTAFHLVGEARCGDMGTLNAGNRLDGKNLVRFREARNLLAPNERLPASAILLLANYQVELEKQKPDPVLAGTYIGNVAKLPVTPELISQVSDGLCVIPPEDKQNEIANAAEEQRLSILEKSKQGAVR